MCACVCCVRIKTSLNFATAGRPRERTLLSLPEAEGAAGAGR